ncbi:hypothetical protein CRE_08157 [Caenorhabditis remanei]|uniref:Actin maturation protease n=1 Tax=Caenorhabditis remanei TaxID=31234 RepID=E3M3R3_CAERE|nr:hypothetical protein CRE_08157 [Caenorhabditis remanei]
MDSVAFEFDSLPLITQIRLTNFTGEFGGRVCLNTSKITPQQQKGPTCGLVALSMCLEHFGVKISVDDILERAKSMGFTKQGEMYSVDYMSSLINEYLPNCSKAIEMPNAKEFTQSICEGKHILVAYDCGPNFQPVYSKGNSAHWLLACGFVEKQESIGFIETRESIADPSEIAIIGYQGKSTNLNIFPFNEIIASNAQLFEAGSKRDPDEYIIPNPADLSEIRNRVVEIGSNSC